MGIEPMEKTNEREVGIHLMVQIQVFRFKTNYLIQTFVISSRVAMAELKVIQHPD